MKNLIITSILFAMSGCTMFSGPSVNEAVSQANNGYSDSSSYNICKRSDMAELVDWVESRPLRERYYNNNNSFKSPWKKGEKVPNMFGGPPLVMDGEDYSVDISYHWHNIMLDDGRSICYPRVVLLNGEKSHPEITGRTLSSYAYEI